MRRQSGTRVVVIGAFALIALAGTLKAQQPAVQKSAVKAAAYVNGEPISLQDVQAILKQDTPPVHPPTEAQKREDYQNALDMLIDECLMRQFLQKHASPISPADIARDMAELQDALKKKGQTMADFYKETGQSEEQVKADIVARLQWQAYITQQFPDAKMKVYYDENKVFFDKVFVRASHILMRVPPKSSDADKQAVRARLSALRAEILAGKIDFATAAKSYSDCPSKAAGGDLGQFAYKFSVQEPFAKAAFAMPVGTMSDIVETEVGYHLIKVTERTPGKESTFEEVRDMVRYVYVQETEFHHNLLTEQRKTAQIAIEPLR